jgi:hypothetical protein
MGEPKNEEKIEDLDLTVRVLFHRLNGKVKYDSEQAWHFFQQVAAWHSADVPQVLAEWYSVETEYGFWEYKAYPAPNGFYVRAQWVPAKGYSWDEEKLYEVAFE